MLVKRKFYLVLKFQRNEFLYQRCLLSCSHFWILLTKIEEKFWFSNDYETNINLVCLFHEWMEKVRIDQSWIISTILCYTLQKLFSHENVSSSPICHSVVQRTSALECDTIKSMIKQHSKCMKTLVLNHEIVILIV